MPADQVKRASRPTLQRLPTYRRVIKQLEADGRETVSCTHIAQALGLEPVQVRKDLATTGIIGKPKVGYLTHKLIAAIDGFLGWNNVSDALLAGAGHLGCALLGYTGFADYGLNIVAAFDSDPAKVGQTVNGKPVLALEKLPDLAARMQVHIGILTVPADAAQAIADLMVGSGIRAIWNFTPGNLDVPPGTIVEHVRLSESLAVLSNRLAESLRD